MIYENHYFLKKKKKIVPHHFGTYFLVKDLIPVVFL
jgi:hypothetical protein